MAMYDLHCQACDAVETFCWLSMQDAMDGRWTECPTCFGPRTRLYGRPPAEHSDSRFKMRWSDQLTEGQDPVLVTTADQERHLMSQMGLKRWEPGMDRDAHAARAAQERERKQRAMAPLREEFCRKAAYVNSYGKMPERGST